MSRITTKVLYEVSCNECGKLFEKVIEVKENSEDETTEQLAYCPYCDKMVRFEIKGKPPEDLVIKRLRERGALDNIQNT